MIFLNPKSKTLQFLWSQEKNTFMFQNASELASVISAVAKGPSGLYVKKNNLLTTLFQRGGEQIRKDGGTKVLVESSRRCCSPAPRLKVWCRKQHRLREHHCLLHAMRWSAVGEAPNENIESSADMVGQGQEGWRAPQWETELPPH